jgi:3-oxoacyl-[acyl-carrier protein] reductase
VSEAKRVLVLGGSGVLGSAVCEALGRAGARVALSYCEGEERAREVGGPLEAALIHADLRDVAQVERAVEEAVAALGGLDALVHCAGVGVTTSSADPDLAEIDEAAYDRMFELNTKSVFFAARAATPHLAAAGGGNLVFVGSVDGSKPLPAPVHYAVSKGALEALARALGKKLGAQGIRTVTVSPGVLTDGLSRTIGEDLLTEYEKHCGLRRRGEPREAADVIAWFATENTYVTGQTVLVDGAL